MASSLILASGSSARRALLEASGVAHRCHPVALDEERVRLACQARGETLRETALVLAEEKARLACAQLPAGTLVIGADQILDLDGEAFAKPTSLSEVRTQLERLRGKTHILQTAVVLMRDGRRVWHEVAAPRLTMRAFSDAFLDAYIAQEGDALFSCVGAYRLEGLGVQLFAVLDGAHDAVLGLPRLGLMEALRQEGVLLP
ncbi:Maf family protein [Neokomagataea anthophila]|uniref:Nucleoside triphosphate pyrophosphatase n=1 Tax=Neokomagataea anthophila TaxID=2826925 RepID=A0ABS5E7K0_9PROT|nr:nucleoside triphosphate pyrophosphatase [Neokomagataea anthophila]MBR0559880.1 Maf-like protein [Neokomagataea anthophila]